jgi:hypothetical protein
MIRLKAARQAGGLMALALTIPLAVGCGSGSGTVNGKVTYKGQPLTMGTVTFMGTTGNPATAPINPDGTYKAVKVPLGQVKVGVAVPNTPAVPRGRTMDPSKFGGAKPPPEDGPKPVVIPTKYSSPDTSELSYDVKKGDQTIDIDLK